MNAEPDAVQPEDATVLRTTRPISLVSLTARAYSRETLGIASATLFTLMTLAGLVIARRGRRARKSPRP